MKNTGPQNENELEAMLSEPSEAVIKVVRALEGDFVVLGAGGKMGPTFAMMLKKAVSHKTVYAVSRFSDKSIMARLEMAGVKPISADLLEPDNHQQLPQVRNVFYLLGMKFGSTGKQPLTWVINSFLPGPLAYRYRESNIVVFSTGNVYPYVKIGERAPCEDTEPRPMGEYAQSCLGRERVFQYFSERHRSPMTIVRLNYANEPRYGIIVDLAMKIIHEEPIDLRVPAVNLIWQRDAIGYIIRSITLAQSPPTILNVAGPDIVRIRALALQIADKLGKKPIFSSPEGTDALLSDASKCTEKFGPSLMGLPEMVSTIVDWIVSGKDVLNKPTKFEVSDGRF